MGGGEWEEIYTSKKGRDTNKSTIVFINHFSEAMLDPTMNHPFMADLLNSEEDSNQMGENIIYVFLENTKRKSLSPPLSLQYYYRWSTS